MNVVVLGGGVVGVTSAWYLAQAGHQVTVLERQTATGMETSFANGGQVAAGSADPWANPRALPKILKWLGKADAPLMVRWRADPGQWRWMLEFMVQCLPHRYRENLGRTLELGVYSRTQLAALRRATGIRYHALQRGILHFYTDQGEFRRVRSAFDRIPGIAAERRLVSVDEMVSIEPALDRCRALMVGGVYTDRDESGDAYAFTQALTELCRTRGVVFRLGCTVRRLNVVGDRVQAVEIIGDDGQNERVRGDGYVVSLGSYSPLLLRHIGIRTSVYPVKGYSATIPIGDHSAAPAVSLTDETRKLVFSRLGDRLRVAGTAELAGYDTDLDATRCAALLQRTLELWPELGGSETVTYWTGLRPATPGNVPLIGATRYSNLFLNTGHGTLGWTLSCGSGRVLADIISGRTPEVGRWYPARRGTVDGSAPGPRGG